jgi:epoxide hydrolase 4
LHYVSSGDGPLVVLLHGFPEFWYSWRHQLAPLAEAGFRALALDLRGYNESEKPRGVSSYRTAKLVADVAGLICVLGGAPAIVVGHDWGGLIAWRLAAIRPELVGKLVVLNAPHPRAFLAELKRSPSQWLRSSYALFFQLPWLPELSIRAKDFALLERTFRSQPAQPGAFSECEIEEYKRAFDRPYGLTGPLNYYRAAARWSSDLYSEPQNVTAPAMLLWGQRDPFLSPQLTKGLERWAPRVRVEQNNDASHWIQNELPQWVNSLLIDFIRMS